MTAPVLTKPKFWIVVPCEQLNYIKNPTFAPPDFVEDWAASGTGVTITKSDDYQRRGAYSMKVNTATGVTSAAYYANLGVTQGVTYAFSCDVKGVAGQAMRIFISDVANNIKATTTFTATGYWQRKSVLFTATESASNYYVAVSRDAIASTAPYYVDGAQFEHWQVTTFFDGYSPGCHWTGLPRNSTSMRSDNTGLGGALVDLNDYCDIVSVAGLGHGDWNQILTKMTTGGDMYQTHIRKSKRFSIIVDFIGDSLGEIESKRKALINMLRPDLLSNLSVHEQFGINMPGSFRGHEQRIIRYQGFDDDGNEATQPVDIICVPLEDTLIDTPELPSHQRAVLNFTIPSGLPQGAYNEGKVLDLYAQFPAENIVKRDPNGNWCKWNGTSYDNIMKGQGIVQGLNGDVFSIAEGPDGKIYFGGDFTNAGGITGANYLARWNPLTEQWESVITGINASVRALMFDANGDLYMGGFFTDFGGTNGDRIVKITNLSGIPSVQALGTGLNGACTTIAIASNGEVYAGGVFTLAGGVTGTAYIAKWNGATWNALSTGLNYRVNTLAFDANGILYIGGYFTNTAYPYFCKWDGTGFSPVGKNTDINDFVHTMAINESGKIYIGGQFLNASGVVGANFIASWNGSQWEALGIGVNGVVYNITITLNKLYASGSFIKAGGLSLTDRIAVWTNGAWQPMDIDLPGSDIVYSVFCASDGSLYIGGNFSTIASSENAKAGIVSDELRATGVTSASANTYPIISFTGPGTLKSIINHRTGKSVMFDGLTLQAGEWASFNFDPLQLSFRSGWAGRGNLMRYIIPGSDYGDFYLSPGVNYISVFMTDTTTASNASIVWTPRFWGLDGALLE